ncbi:hypothetical protein GCM10020218_055850 [Dactylosporangium vinaceum]
MTAGPPAGAVQLTVAVPVPATAVTAVGTLAVLLSGVTAELNVPAPAVPGFTELIARTTKR